MEKTGVVWSTDDLEVCIMRKFKDCMLISTILLYHLRGVGPWSAMPLLTSSEYVMRHVHAGTA